MRRASISLHLPMLKSSTLIIHTHDFNRRHSSWKNRDNNPNSVHMGTSVNSRGAPGRILSETPSSWAVSTLTGSLRDPELAFTNLDHLIGRSVLEVPRFPQDNLKISATRNRVMLLSWETKEVSGAYATTCFGWFHSKAAAYNSSTGISLKAFP